MTSRLILSYVEREGGREGLERALALAGCADREAELRDENRWTSFATKIALFEAAAQVLGDERVAIRVGASVLEHDIGTGLKRVLRALGSPRLVYGQVVRACAKFNVTHRMAAERLDGTSAVLRYEDTSGAGSHRHDCDYNLGLLACVPELFGLPPARVAHPLCALNGADACVYEVHWTETARGDSWAPLTAATACAGAAAAALAGVPGTAEAALGLAVATQALGLRTWSRIRRERERMLRRIGDQDEAADRLAASLRDLGEDLRPEEVVTKIARNGQSAVGGKEFAVLVQRDDAMRCVSASAVPLVAQIVLEGWADKASLGTEALIVDDVATVAPLARLLETPGMPLRSLCAAPLRFRGRLLGVLVALSNGRDGFLPHDAELLSLYAAEAAIALSNAELVDRLQRLAEEDPLTGLANQRRFHAALAAQAAASERGGEPLSLVALDLDHFKRVNDTHGHPVGDDVLRAVAAELTDEARPGDLAARLGGEEFALLLPGTAPDEAHRIAETARARIAAIAVEGITLSVSAGIASLPADTTEGAALLRCADEALYWAKRAGRDRTRRYDGTPAPGSEAEKARERVQGVLADPDAVQIVLQPIVTLATGEVAGYEALARFPTLDLRPDQAFALAWENDLGPELEALALRCALALPGRPEGTYLTLNVSPSALGSPNLWAALPEDMSGLVVELTEHELYESDHQLEAGVRRLRERGARIAVDDTGSGYAGLQQLARVRPDVVKLDRALVDGVRGDSTRAALIEAFVAFAASTGAAVCAEGVERLDDLQTLAALRVTAAQGYVLARPAAPWAVPSADAVAVLQEPRARQLVAVA